MSFKEHLNSFYTKRPQLIGAMVSISIVTVISERRKTENLLMLAGLTSTTFFRDSLMEEAEKHARTGAMKRAYLEAIGAGLASIVGRTTMGLVFGNGLLEGRFTGVVGITAATTGIVDAIQNISRVSRIVNEKRSAIPPVYLQ